MYLKITLHSAAAEEIIENYITFSDPGGINYVIIVGPTVFHNKKLPHFPRGTNQKIFHRKILGVGGPEDWIPRSLFMKTSLRAVFQMRQRSGWQPLRWRSQPTCCLVLFQVRENLGTPALNQKHPRAHKNKIGTSPPPQKNPKYPPPKTRNFMDMALSCRKNAFLQAPIKLVQPFPAPELRTEILRKRGFFWLNQARNKSTKINFWVQRPPGGVGVFHAKGWWPKSSCPPSKVCLPWVSKGGIWDVPGVLPGCPGPLAVFKKFVRKKFVRIFRPLLKANKPPSCNQTFNYNHPLDVNPEKNQLLSAPKL